MKLLAYILMTICLTFGTLSAITAYSPLLSLPDESLIGLMLNEDAGAVPADPADAEGDDAESAAPAETDDAGESDAHSDDAPELEPIAGQDDELTPELLAQLRGAGIKRVRVKEFAFGRWEHWWLMVASCVGLIVAAITLKLQTRREIAAKLEAPGEKTESPEHALAEVRATIESVTATLPTLGSSHEKMEVIIDRIGALQWAHLQAILDARTVLIGRLKLSGYAEFMDRFSAFERQLNRAWSAAADGVLEESVNALDAAHELLPQVEAKLHPERAT